MRYQTIIIINDATRNSGMCHQYFRRVGGNDMQSAVEMVERDAGIGQLCKAILKCNEQCILRLHGKIECRILDIGLRLVGDV